MIPGAEEFEPLVNVIALEQAIGGEVTTAFAMGAGIGEKNREAVA